MFDIVSQLVSRKSWFLKESLLVLLTLCLSACDQSQVPLKTPVAADADDRLVGVWHSKIQDNDVYLHIIPMEKPWLRLIRVTHINHGGISENDQVDFFPSAIGTRRFVNLKFRKAMAIKDDHAVPQDAYWFFKYDIAPNGAMTVWTLDYASVQAAVNTGKLAGKAWETTWDSNVDLTDNADHIVSFLNTLCGKQYTEYGQFRRMQEAP